VGDPTDLILAAASRLIGLLGVDGTAMSRIAAEAGLKQSSLYYYFHRKEEIVAALVARANVVPLELARRITDEGAPAAVQIYRFVRADVVALCALPFDINEIHRIAARDTAGFADYWTERATLEGLIEAWVRQGIGDGELREVDPVLTAMTILSNDEGVQNWFRLGTGREPRTVGAAVADLVVGGLVAAPSRLERIRRSADRADFQ
jgi:TetR/AcrR family transcriptional regulator